MRALASLGLSLLCLLSSVMCADQKIPEYDIHVYDAQHHAVNGARVVMTSAGSVVTSGVTDARGEVILRPSQAADVLQVEAAGFAPARVSPDSKEVILSVAAQPETVVVTATRDLAVADHTGTPTEALDSTQIENLNPVALNDAIQFMPGAIVTSVGQRGGQSSLFVRGGDSRYNKVIIDGVPVNDPGGTFDFGVVPTQEVNRVEFARGPESALYGTDAMTSTVQLFSATGKTHTPELRFGTDGGNYATAHGYASLSGAYRKLDYNVFGDQFNTSGKGINDDYSNSSQGANVGYAFTSNAGIRFAVRHSNNRVGVQSNYVFNGAELLPPDSDQFARQNNFLSSLSLHFATGAQWRHSLSGYEYHHKRENVDRITDAGREELDFPFADYADLNRAGFNYQTEWTPIAWMHAIAGYNYENENGYFGDLTLVAPGSPLTHGLRRNHTLFGEDFVSLGGRVTLLGGVSYVNNEYFGSRVLPRASVTLLAFKGQGAFSGTRLRGAYGQGIKEPRFEEVFGIGVFGISANNHLKPEQSRSIEGGVTQGLFDNSLVLSATYYHQRFTDQITFDFDPATFFSQYVNLNRTLAHGAEVEAHQRINQRTSLDASYFYTATQILNAPLSFDPLQSAGSPLLRRPKHAGTILLNHSGAKWGGVIGGSFIGRRTDEDFSGFNITHAAGYALVNMGGWFRVNRFVTAYANLDNALDRSYNSALGYPGLPINVRAGLRFTLGGD